MKTKKGLPTLSFKSQQDWEAWLEKNHAKSKGTWIKFAKKNSRIESVTLSEAQESAVCYGWVDGLAAPLNDAFWLLRFTPRRPKSRWSKTNRERAIRLAAQGRLKAAGLKAIESAKQDGRWSGA